MAQRRPFLLALTVSVTLSSAVSLVACSDALRATTTGGARITLRTTVTTAGEASASTTNAFGWTIRLSKAVISVGPLYYFDGEPLLAFGSTPPRRGFWGAFSLVAVAHAHPGHYVAGNAKGEMRTPTSVDLALGDAALPDGTGVAGPYRSARFTFAAPPAGPEASSLGGAVLLVEGRATRATSTVEFRAAVKAEDVYDASGEPKVEGCVFEAADVVGDGTVVVRVRPSIWLEQVDFAAVEPSPDGSAVDLAGTTAWNAFVRGVKKGTAYVFSFAP